MSGTTVVEMFQWSQRILLKDARRIKCGDKGMELIW